MAKAITVEVVLTQGIITPEQLAKLIEEVETRVPAGGTEGIILSGRLPVWAFAALAHLFHPRPWVATFDPRLGGGVVIASHVSDVSVGQVVSPTETTVTVEFLG